MISGWFVVTWVLRWAFECGKNADGMHIQFKFVSPETMTSFGRFKNHSYRKKTQNDITVLRFENVMLPKMKYQTGDLGKFFSGIMQISYFI